MGGAGFAPLALLTVAAAVQGAALIVLSWSAGTVRTRWVAADAAVLGAALLVAALVLHPHDSSGPGVAYSWVLLSSMAIGLAGWPLLPTLAAGSLLGAVSAAVELGLVHSQPVWNVVPNSLSFPGLVLTGWAVATQLRSLARQTDQSRADALDRAVELARERERTRYAHALRARVLATLDAVHSAGAVAEPAIRDQLLAEREWLRQLVDSGWAARSEDLLAALRLAGRAREATGLRVDLRAPADPAALAGLPGEQVEALAGAVWEALTNVSKHAGTTEATIRVSHTHTEIVVEVSDAGRGFDPAGVTGGFGLAGSIRHRMRDVAGRAEIDSEPGRGTTVRLRVPRHEAPEAARRPGRRAGSAATQGDAPQPPAGGTG